MLHYIFTTIDNVNFRITFISNTNEPIEQIYDKTYISNVPLSYKYLNMKKISNFELDYNDKGCYYYYTEFFPEIIL